MMNENLNQLMNFDMMMDGDEEICFEEDLTFPSNNFANYMAHNSIYVDDWDKFVDNEKSQQQQNKYIHNNAGQIFKPQTIEVEMNPIPKCETEQMEQYSEQFEDYFHNQNDGLSHNDSQFQNTQCNMDSKLAVQPNYQLESDYFGNPWFQIPIQLQNQQAMIGLENVPKPLTNLHYEQTAIHQYKNLDQMLQYAQIQPLETQKEIKQVLDANTDSKVNCANIFQELNSAIDSEIVQRQQYYIQETYNVNGDYYNTQTSTIMNTKTQMIIANDSNKGFQNEMLCTVLDDAKMNLSNLKQFTDDPQDFTKIKPGIRVTDHPPPAIPRMAQNQLMTGSNSSQFNQIPAITDQTLNAQNHSMADQLIEPDEYLYQSCKVQSRQSSSSHTHKTLSRDDYSCNELSQIQPQSHSVNQLKVKIDDYRNDNGFLHKSLSKATLSEYQMSVDSLTPSKYANDSYVNTMLISNDNTMSMDDQGDAKEDRVIEKRAIFRALKNIFQKNYDDYLIELENKLQNQSETFREQTLGTLEQFKHCMSYDHIKNTKSKRFMKKNYSKLLGNVCYRYSRLSKEKFFLNKVCNFLFRLAIPYLKKYINENFKKNVEQHQEVLNTLVAFSDRIQTDKCSLTSNSSDSEE
eukprot:403335089